ncbi:hypothetical protein BHE74_00020138 [Ensete ventricosum]|nr:hypothetical protein BHE74_00020138 [Ensete ventricosum]
MPHQFLTILLITPKSGRSSQVSICAQTFVLSNNVNLVTHVNPATGSAARSSDTIRGKQVQVEGNPSSSIPNDQQMPNVINVPRVPAAQEDTLDISKCNGDVTKRRHGVGDRGGIVRGNYGTTEAGLSWSHLSLALMEGVRMVVKGAEEPKCCPYYIAADSSLWKQMTGTKLKVWFDISIIIFRNLRLLNLNDSALFMSSFADRADMHGNPYSQHHPSNWVGAVDDEDDDDDEELCVHSTPHYYD